MILPDDRPESPSKLPQPAQPFEAAQDAPPAYPGHEAGSSTIAAGPPPISETQPLNQSVQPVYVPVYVKEVPEHGRRARKRFCQTFLVAFIVYLALCAIVKSIFDIASGHSRGDRFEREDAVTAQPRADDGKILSCIKGADHWANHDGQLTTTFKLDRWSDKLYLFSRGMQLTGNVVIMQDESLHQPGAVKVDVIAHNHAADWLHAVQVCSLERKSGEQGVGIFEQSPARWRSRYHLPELEFEVVVRFPKLEKSESLLISSFETNMPNFSQHIGDLKDKILFKDLSLKSSNSHIASQSLRALNAEIITSNSRIVGDYEASELLKLVTTNDIINVTATMVHLNPKASGPVLRMSTSNRQIVSSVNLVSKLPTVAFRQGGSFAIEANTSNARLALDFPTAPIDSVVNVIAGTSNAKAAVRMHPTWEGNFAIATSNQMAVIDNSQPDDPSGKGRSRTVAVVGGWEKSQGLAMWDGMYMGKINLLTTNARAEVYL